MSEMPPRASLKTFLSTARAALTAPSSKRTTPLTFVVGNESADLDSLCSALLLAYFHTYSPPPTQRGSAGNSQSLCGINNSNNTLHIPICHLQRADLALRPEFAAVLRDADVKGEDVFTLEDVLPPPPPPPHHHHHHHEGNNNNNNSKKEEKKSNGEEILLRPEDTRWLLVDHNAMTGALGRAFGTRVFGCVDHHADEDAVPRDAEVRVVEKSGSCMSLVVERCADIWEALGGSSRKIDAQLARLALAPVLVDTTNLGDENKTTAHDVRAVVRAEGKIAAHDAEEKGEVEVEKYDRDAFFKRIMDLKEDIADMSFRDVFRKDYKEWTAAVEGGVRDLRLGTSSVPRGFGYLVDTKADGGGDPAAVFVDALEDWGREKDGSQGKMDLVVVLTGFRDQHGTFRRELLVWARSEAGVRAAELFEKNWGDRLGLETWGDGGLDLKRDDDDGWRRCWAQRAVEHSRKQIAPMLRDALKEVAAG
ncbi:exopolyphosphatase-like protein [Xylaria castorea]|nr:exopolyphosphatase-like protein [Xylaria castorea]